MNKNSSNSGFIRVVQRELSKIGRSRLLFLDLFILPPVAIGFFIWFFSQGVLHDLPVAVWDQEHSPLSRAIIRQLDATPSIRIHKTVSGFLEGKRMVETGECYALVVIPDELEKNSAHGLSPATILYINNTYVLIASLITRDATSAMQSLSGSILTRRFMAKGESADSARNHTQPVKLDLHIPFNPYINYFFFLAAALLPTMFHMFVVLTAVYSIGSELSQKTADKWFQAANKSLFTALAGKLFPYTIVYILWALIMNTSLFNIGVPMNGSRLIIRMAVVSMILAYQAVALFMVAAFANLRLSLSFSSFYVSTAFAFVGITFPVIGMPYLARMYGKLLPLTHYLQIFVDQAMRGASLHTTLLCFRNLWLIFGITGSLGFFLMHKRLNNPDCWGRS